MSHYDPRGSQWAKWDLHFHTPSSYDYLNKAVSDEEIIDALVTAEIRVVAITDHHTIDVERIRRLQGIAADRVTILPGIELRSDQGGKPVHYICIFPEDSRLEDLWTSFQGYLGLTPTEIEHKGGSDRVYVPIEDGASKAHELGGIVTIHAGKKSNSIEGIENSEQFQQQIKFDITNRWVDLMEIGQLKDVETHLSTIFPATGLDKGLIICSDNHDALKYRQKVPLWVKASPTFCGLQMVLREPRERIFLGERPLVLARVEQNSTKYVRSLAFSRLETAPPEAKWFGGDVPFNTGLVAIIGNKGSGKSALADVLGLLGATRRSAQFSFLNPRQFLHSTIGLGAHFKARIQWCSDENSERCLEDRVEPDEVERVQYLPQDHVERVCNELTGLGEDGFENELKAVIFSHVEEEHRLGCATLDELVQFRTTEKQRRIDTLLKQLREESRRRAALESRTDPVVRNELQKRISQRQLELDAHEQRKPQVVSTPAEGTSADPEVLQTLSKAEEKRKELSTELAINSDATRLADRRQAVANRLLEGLGNLQKDFDSSLESLAKDAGELDLDPAKLATLSIHRDAPTRILDEASSHMVALRQKAGTQKAPGLRQALDQVEHELAELRARLNAPQREYQQFLANQEVWEQQRSAIIGSLEAPESLEGIKKSLADLEELPSRIEAATNAQLALALEILELKLSQVGIYRELFGAVQQFANAFTLSNGKLPLEFRAELVNENFGESLLNILNQNRRGSFMGSDQGRARIGDMTSAVRWGDPKSVQAFLTNVDAALHSDQRPTEPSEKLLIKDQLIKGKKPEDVFDLLYGLEYVLPRYALRWEGKDLSMLSPGERGTLLLVFYLLIERGDTPLIIDQPEGNLDNYTVAKVLIECIKKARQRRQVFIVTHNPNLAVVCDADQVVHARMDKADGNAVTYSTGALEDPSMSGYVTDVLEGTRWAFDVRGAKYEVTK